MNQNFDPLEQWRPTLCKEYYKQEDIHVMSDLPKNEPDPYYNDLPG